MVRAAEPGLEVFGRPAMKREIGRSGRQQVTGGDSRGTSYSPMVFSRAYAAVA